MSIKFAVHPLFLVLVCILIYMGQFWLLLAYLVTILLHELAHAVVAYRFGYKLNLITLMPHGASISGSNVYFNYRDEIWIAIAGPLFNVLLATVGVALWWVFPTTYAYTDYFVWANIVTAVVNCLPIYPLDGGRVLLALLSIKKTRNSAQKIVRVLGISLSAGLIVGFVVTTFFVPNYTLLMFGGFLFVTSILEDKTSHYTRVSTISDKIQRINKGIKIRDVAVPCDTTLYKLFRETSPNTITQFTVLGDDLSVIGHIDEQELERLLLVYPATATLRTVM